MKNWAILSRFWTNLTETSKFFKKKNCDVQKWANIRRFQAQLPFFCQAILSNCIPLSSNFNNLVSSSPHESVHKVAWFLTISPQKNRSTSPALLPLPAINLTADHVMHFNSISLPIWQCRPLHPTQRHSHRLIGFRSSNKKAIKRAKHATSLSADGIIEIWWAGSVLRW